MKKKHYCTRCQILNPHVKESMEFEIGNNFPDYPEILSVNLDFLVHEINLINVDKSAFGIANMWKVDHDDKDSTRVHAAVTLKDHSLYYLGIFDVSDWDTSHWHKKPCSLCLDLTSRATIENDLTVTPAEFKAMMGEG